MTPRHERFIQAKVEGASHTDAAKFAGYSHATAAQQGSRLFRKVEPEVTRRLSAAMQESGASPTEAYASLRKAYRDDAPAVRPSAVRAAEIILKAAGELAPDPSVMVDARTVVLPGAELLSVAELEALAARLKGVQPRPRSGASENHTSRQDEPASWRVKRPRRGSRPLRRARGVRSRAAGSTPIYPGSVRKPGSTGPPCLVVEGVT